MKSILKKNAGFVIALACIAVVCVLMHLFVFHTVRIEGTSMVDTLRSGDIVLVTRYDYRFGEPKRGDIVECRFPGRSGTYVKRIIGLPGDHIEITQGQTLVNGESISEPYATGPAGDFSAQMGENEYLLLGDNRFESYDSRAADMGCIGKENLLGRVQFVLWPFRKIN